MKIVITPKERRLIAYQARGLTGEEIGQELGLSERTVKEYLSRIRLKLGGLERREQIPGAFRDRTGLDPFEPRDEEVELL